MNIAPAIDGSDNEEKATESFRSYVKSLTSDTRYIGYLVICSRHLVLTGQINQKQPAFRALVREGYAITPFIFALFYRYPSLELHSLYTMLLFSIGVKTLLTYESAALHLAELYKLYINERTANATCQYEKA